MAPPPVPVPFACLPVDRDVPLVVVLLHPTTRRPFLSLCTREYPIAGGGLSGVSGILMALIVDACRILTGLYQARHTLHRELDNSIVTGYILLPGRYYVRVEDEAKNPVEYGLYKNFYSWRPPTRGEVPGHWFTASSPPTFNANHVPPWANVMRANRADMRDHMSEMAKFNDGHRCAVTRVESPDSIEGAHGVPVEKKVFVSLTNLFNDCFRSNKHKVLQA